LVDDELALFSEEDVVIDDDIACFVGIVSLLLLALADPVDNNMDEHEDPP